MASLITALWKPVPRDERSALYDEKLRLYRPFAVLVMWLGSFLSVALWAWDFAIDPVGAPDTLIYRFQVGALLGAFALYLHFGLWPRLRTLAFVATMVASQGYLYLILDVMENGHMVGMGAFLFWYIFLPLVGVGLTLKDTLYGMLGLATAPLLWHALGWSPKLLVDVFVMYMWPAGSVVAIILVANNLFMLQMIRTQKRLQDAKEFAEHQARTDALTHLNNRRAFFEFGGAAFHNAKRYKHPLSVVLLDLDRFKRINDTYGHAIGDAVIQAMAEVIRATARESDIAGRLGGEEFALVLNETALVEAEQMAERLRTAVMQTEIDVGDERLTFSASFGVAQLDVACDDLDTLVARADQALYDAKESGRNRVVVRG